MKIGIFDPYLDSLSGGERYMLTMASCLSQNNEVFVFWDEKGILEKAKEKLAINLDNVKVEKNIFRQSFFEKIKNTAQYDAIIVLSDGSIPFSLSKLYIHFQHPVEWVRPSFIDRIKLTRTKEVICNSEFTKSYINKKFHIQSKVLYPPVEVGAFEAGKKENVIVTVGRFSVLPENTDFKKQSVLIEAFGKLRKQIPNIRLRVVTSVVEHDKPKLEEFIKKYSRAGVEFIISPSFDKFKTVYSDAKIYWHASGFGEDTAKHPERAEHFGISTVEAMSAQAVPVVFNAGGQKEIVRDGFNGLLWETEDELIKKTVGLMTNQKQLLALSAQAAESVKKFDQKAFCEKLLTIIS